MATTPTVNKLWIAKLLTDFRDKTGLSQEDVALGVFPRFKSKNNARVKLAQVENAQSNFKSHGDLVTALDYYADRLPPNVITPALRQWLLEAFDHTSQLGRWRGPRATFDPKLRQLIDLEEDASRIWLSCSEIMPGLLQCEDYVRALFQAPGTVASEQFEYNVEARLDRARQTILRTEKRPPQLVAVLAQSCLERYAGTATRAVMRKQMEYLLELTAGSYPHVLLQVIANETETPLNTQIINFTLLRIPSPGLAGPLDIVYTEGAGVPDYIDDKDGVAAFETRWSQLTSAAMSPADSRRTIDEFRLSFV